MSSLLDDITLDHHAELLAHGNLKPRPPAVSWSDENSWRSEGYLARILTTTCRCGNSWPTLTGVFHVETTPSGKRKELRLSDTALLQLTPESLHLHHSDARAGICVKCLPKA